MVKKGGGGAGYSLGRSWKTKLVVLEVAGAGWWLWVESDTESFLAQGKASCR